jgi:hypothetical protein
MELCLCVVITLILLFIYMKSTESSNQSGGGPLDADDKYYHRLLARNQASLGDGPAFFNYGPPFFYPRYFPGPPYNYGYPYYFQAPFVQ